MLEFVVAVTLGVIAGAAGAWLSSRASKGASKQQVLPFAADTPTTVARWQQRLEAQRSELDAWLAALRAPADQAPQLNLDAAKVVQDASNNARAVSEVSTMSQEVGRQLQALTDSVANTSLAIDEMTFGSLEVAKNIEELSRTCEETAASMVEMDVSIGAVESNAHETSRLSAQVNLDAETGARALHQTIEGIHRIRDGNRTATDVIEELDQKIFAVTKILGVIDDVAEQTNLLALNAAIIAAQAGEHGRGFAVVADEIKALAERTGASTREIAELILTMQEQSQRATDSMATGLANVEDGVALGNNAGDALLKIVASAKRSTSMAENIAQATIEQSQRSKQVTDAISRIAETVAQIAYATAEQAKGAQHLNQSTAKVREVVNYVQESFEKQGRTGDNVTLLLQQLPEVVGRFQQALTEARQTQDGLAVRVSAALDALAGDGTAPQLPLSTLSQHGAASR